MSERRVVITGLGLVTPLGTGVDQVWERMLRGESGVREVSGEGTEASEVRAVGDVREEDLETIRLRIGEVYGEQAEKRTLFGLWASEEALADAGIEGRLETVRGGVLFSAGLGVNRLEDIARYLDRDGEFNYPKFWQNPGDIHPESIIRNNSNLPAALIARRYCLNGINATVTTACASATQAIGTALRVIRRGEADLMVAGGADSMINPVGLVFFVLLSAASTSTDPPETVCRPFDRRRSGLVMGEGAGVVVLEEEGHARQRGARIYGEVAGYGSSIDAYQVTAPHPKGEGAELSMRRALDDAGLQPEEIDYINAHGTGTKLNDLAETLAIKRVFGEHARRLAVSSSKSMTGHLLAASGGPEFVFTTLSVYNNRVHPTINLTRVDPKCDLDYVSEGSRKMEVRAALSNSFGFGGQNGSIIVRKYRIR
jgi:3-oxoacyl-[acyl-carrier-protein] synthase II